MECSSGLVFFMQEVMRLKKTSQTTDLVLALFLYIPVVWAALLIAQSLGGGLPELLSNLTAALEQPFQIQWTDKSLLSILVCTGAYLMGLCLYASGQGRTRDGEEHGSAAWGSPRQLNAQFRQKENKILTRHVRLGLDTHKHRRSLNVLVIGGSGAAKTRGYVKPNILEANSNYVITDPKMEVLTATKTAADTTYTAGGIKTHVEDGKLVIDQEGREQKMIDTVEQITFSGAYANKTGQPVMYITERAVFELRSDGVYLTEVAPGIDVQKQVVDQMGFTPKMEAGGPRLMDARIFAEGLMGLK